MGEEAVRQSDHEDTNTSVSSARWQEGEKFMRGVCGAQNSDDFTGAACGINGCDGGRRDLKIFSAILTICCIQSKMVQFLNKTVAFVRLLGLLCYSVDVMRPANKFGAYDHHCVAAVKFQPSLLFCPHSGKCC